MTVGPPPAAPWGELARKSVHVGMGFVALSLRWLEPWQAVAMLAAAVAFNLWALHPLTCWQLLRPNERRARFSVGVALYPMMLLVVAIALHRRLELVAAVWALMAFGDGMAAIVGRLLAGPRLPWNPAKTWSGLVAFVLFGGGASAFLIRWTQLAVLDDGSERVDWIGPAFLHGPGDGPRIASLIVGCLLAASVAGIVESIRSSLDDNVRVTVVGTTVFVALTWIRPDAWLAAWPSVADRLPLALGVNVLLAAAAWALGGVDRSGAVVGLGIGSAIFAVTGWSGFVILIAFFLLGTGATRIGASGGHRDASARRREGRRSAKQALANAGPGVAFATLSVATFEPEAFLLAVVAAFAAAAGDTVSSEIGQSFGGRPYLVTTLRPVPGGTDGAISIVGTLAGTLAVTIVAVAGVAVGLASWSALPLVLAAGVAGGLVDSLLGALAERRGLIGNEAVNAVATTAAGWIVIAVY